MCRIGGGTNRCDAHWGQAEKEAYNSRRRAKYAARKNGSVRKYEKQGSAFIKSSFQNQISGDAPIDWSALDKDSYKAFGFQDITVERDELMMESVTALVEQSKEEMKTCTEDEMFGIRFFSSSNYDWINEQLYSPEKAPKSFLESPELREAKAKAAFENNRKGQPDFSYYDTVGQTPEMLTKVTEAIDSALDKGNKQEKIVYRGLRSETLFNKADADQSDFDSISLGQEMVFDGYQSTSLHPMTATAYCDLDPYAHFEDEEEDEDEAENVVLMEIKTKQGVNIMSQSQYLTEYEVLMPRGARYMVVGAHSQVPYKAKNEGKSHVFNKVNVLQMVAVDESGKLI